MKKHLRVTMVVLVILALLVGTFPASAEAIRAPLSGTSTWTGDLEPDPDVDVWMVGKDGLTIYQMRNDTQFYDVEADDDRFDGYNISEVDAAFHYDAEGNLIEANLWGKSVTYKNPDHTEPIWNCSAVAKIDSSWNFSEDMLCHGVGEYKGLLAKVTFGIPLGDIYPFEGYILEPGGE